MENTEGLINGGMQEQQPGAQDQQDQKGGFTANAEQFIKNVYEKIDPADKESLDRVVVAGQKLMFSKETHQAMLDAIEGEGDMADKLGMGIVQLMMILFQQSKGNMPPQVIMPAASILLAKACEYIERTGGEMSTAIFGEALKLTTVGLHRQLSKMTGEQPSGQQQEQPPSGIINQNMQPAPQGG